MCCTANDSPVADSLNPTQNIPSFVRFCRDYSIADLFFVTFTAISGAYAISTNSSIRTGVCEEVSSQPDFIRDLADMGFNLENCELWFERAVIGVMTATAVVIVVRVSRNIFRHTFAKRSLRTAASHPLPLRNLGSFRDFHLELLLATLPLPVVVVNVVDNVYGTTFHGLCISSPDLFAARANRLAITLGKREAGGVRLFAGRTQ